MPSTNEITLSEAIEEGVEAVQERVDRNGLMYRFEYTNISNSIHERDDVDAFAEDYIFLNAKPQKIGEICEKYDIALCEIGQGGYGGFIAFIDVHDNIGVPIFVSFDKDDVDSEKVDINAILDGIADQCAGGRAVADGGFDQPRDDGEKEIAEAVTQPERDRTPDAINVAGVDDDTPDISEAGLGDFMGGDSPFASDDTPDPTPDMTGGNAMIGMATGAIPLEQIEHKGFDEKKRIVSQGGRTWPSTDALRNTLEDEICKAMMNSDDNETVIAAPTSLGKSYTVASKRWGAFDNITDEKPVIHAHKTRDARDEAAAVSEEEGVNHFVLRSREELCPVCRGDFDPENCKDGCNDEITVNEMPVSEYIEMKIERGGIPFSDAHKMAEKRNDQGVKLPCQHDGECPAIAQWEEWRNGDHSITHCTHPFTFVPSVRMESNVVIDEEPNFEMELGSRGEKPTERLRGIVEAYLTEVGAMVNTWEEFWSIATARNQKKRLAELHFDSDNPKWEAKKEGYGPSTYKKAIWEEFEEQLRRNPNRDWYAENNDAHTAAKGLVAAILDLEDSSGDRKRGQTSYSPMRIDDQATEQYGYNFHNLTVIFDGSNKVAEIVDKPDFTQTNSLIGLDAHPAMRLWRNHVYAGMEKKVMMASGERSDWRQFEKGLEVIQVGDATRPLTSLEYYNDDITRTIVEQLVDEYGEDFRTALTSAAAENDLLRTMNSQGCFDPEVMHYGEEKSRNDFEGEDVGLVLGCIDPGDDMVMNELAVAGLDAEPETTEIPCPNCTHDDHDEGEGGPGCANCMKTGFVREKGRNFVGEDAEEAEEVLASVRENHVCQAIGRYGRNPEDPEDTAKVFVATDAMPDYMVDVKVPGAITTYEGHQENIVEVLRDSAEPMRTQEIANEVGCTARNVRSFLNDQAEIGRVEKSPRQGKNGATLYAETGLLESGALEVEEDVLRKQPVQGYNDTWCFRTAEPTALVDDFGTGEDSNEEVTADDDAESSGLSGPLDS